MNIISTELNQRLSDIVRNRIVAESFLAASRSGFWRFLGIGLIAFGIGTAVGISFFGYAHIIQNTDKTNILASTLSKALSEVHLKAVAEGTVRIEPREIKLAKDQTITLDRNSRLRLDPAATVVAEGEIRVQTPSISVPQATTTQRAGAKVPEITNFTVFKSVSFAKGDVMTGWMFLTSTQKSPTHQYCYYTEGLDGPGLSVNIDIATNQQLEKPKNPPKDFDITAAFDKCTWFRE